MPNIIDILIKTIEIIIKLIVNTTPWLTWTLLFLLPVIGLVGICYFLLGVPMRRQERTRLLLDLIETGIKRGLTPEQAVVAASHTKDPAIGPRMYLVARWIDAGLTLAQALRKVPSFVPKRITEMIEVGRQTGTLERMLNVCRRATRDGVSQTRGAGSYMMAMVFVLLPVFPILIQIITASVFPKFQEIFKDMLEPNEFPLLTFQMLGWCRLISPICIVMVLFFQLCALLWLAQNRLQTWMPRLADWIEWRLPWRRNRMRRDFSRILGMLLDVPVPEEQALQLAATATASLRIKKRADAACSALRQGIPLPAALNVFDDTMELEWRMTNAVHAGKGFTAALNGWIETLDARAFQQEQAAAHLATSTIVLINGCMVAWVAITAFAALTAIINAGVLW